MALYTCRRCGHHDETLWEGTCPSCHGFYRATKTSEAIAKQRSTFAQAAESKVVYVPTGLDGLDATLGGGLVAGNVVLFGGFPGAGKSTLLVTAADRMAHRRKVIYASSEQNVDGVLQIAFRAGVRNDKVVVLGGQKSIEKTIAEVKSERAFLAIYDSLQKYVSELCAGTPGSASQGAAVAAAIKDDCRARGTCAIVVNQMSKGGQLKGGTDVEHDLDTVLVLAFPKEDDEDAPGGVLEGIRLLVVDKNRNGDEQAKTYWKMHDKDSERPGTIEQVAARSKLIEFPRRGKYSLRD